MIRWVALFAAGAIFGIAGAWVFRRFTDASKLRASVDRMLAYALEMPLFFDEPSVVWRAQRALLAENLRLLRHIAVPCLMMAAAFLLLFAPMEKCFGRKPLAIGETAVVSVPLPGVAIETPPVRVARTGAVSWRVRALAADSDVFPYHGTRTSWVLWFALASMLSAAGISLRR